MKVYSYLTTKNETQRYLAEFLEELTPYVDDLLIYDDQSDDIQALKLMAGTYRLPVVTRKTEEFSFAEDESFFRQQAWDAMVEYFEPTEDDWILSLDADEFLRAPYGGYLAELAGAFNREGTYNGMWFHIHEVWTPIEEPPQVRTDGFWADTKGLRFCRYQPNGHFKEKKLGGGSVPDYVDRTVNVVADVDILHYGYARREDRQKKYDRYRGKSGHSPSHISSILKPPTLAPLPPITYTR